jgi:hypothetical protein
MLCFASLRMRLSYTNTTAIAHPSKSVQLAVAPISHDVPRSGSARRESLGVRMNSVKPALLLSFSQREVWLRADQASPVSEAPTRKLQAFQSALRRWALRGWREPRLRRRSGRRADRTLGSGKGHLRIATRQRFQGVRKRCCFSLQARCSERAASSVSFQNTMHKFDDEHPYLVDRISPLPWSACLRSAVDRKVRSARAKIADSRRVKGGAWE